ncbi:hypothetical protein ERJ75_000037800 [Trypanosoma vivax]|uniref:Uncharacterized protein n=1 Tax=Trypanosoma vivax (strain Y486) TaxID=1055687 RepID=G0U7M3_TRYVY|nr:hypothetical protein TRVL_00393 [Trypanosoma vivax]KAH8620536.1 hypothetical protein ERJ75_000037800 [Trypanosoma vivax]CCC51881.1 conserved hypothetical protein [Trypanosoma vivax Y486]
MLVAHRITSLRHLETQLRRLAREEAALKSRRSHGSGGSLPEPQTKEHMAVRDKLLFRRVPIALSLVERSLLPILNGTQSQPHAGYVGNRPVAYTDGSTVLGISAAEAAASNSLCLEGMSEVERGRCNTLVAPSVLSMQEGQSNKKSFTMGTKPMASLFSSLHFLEQERRKLYRFHMHRLESKLLTAQKRSHSLRGKQRDSSERVGASREVDETRADISLLKGSLLARSYLSARLWRLLLREEIWLPAVQSRATTPRTLLMLLAFTRVGFGVLRDVAQGQPLNTRAPRFVVSLPSRQRRHNSETTSQQDAEKIPVSASQCPATEVTEPPAIAGDATENDPMLQMMLGITATRSEASSHVDPNASKPVHAPLTKKKRATLAARRSTTSKLRWLPPSTHDAVPLVVGTLSLCSAVLRTFNADVISLLRENVSEFFELLLVLQSTASLLLALDKQGNVVDPMNMHSALRHLEDAICTCSGAAKDVLIAHGPDALATLTPVKAARVLLALDSLKLLHDEARDSSQLVMWLVTRMFSQLSTGTQRALLEKSRQTSLFAFATRSQRAKLHLAHRRGDGATALLENARARARLQQRQMQAALRAKYLESVNKNSVKELAEALPVYSLVAVFRLLVRTARCVPVHLSEVRDRLITASLFTLESVFVSAEGDSSRAEETMIHHSDLPALLAGLVTLWPLSHERYQLQQCSGGMFRNSSDSIAKSEFLTVSSAIETVFTTVNAALGERVRRVEDCNPHIAMEDADGVVTAADVVAFVAVLADWPEMQFQNKNRANVEAFAQLIKRLLISDVRLWHEVRRMGKVQRERFTLMLGETMRRFNMLDASVTEALSTVL